MAAFLPEMRGAEGEKKKPESIYISRVFGLGAGGQNRAGNTLRVPGKRLYAPRFSACAEKPRCATLSVRFFPSCIKKRPPKGDRFVLELVVRIELTTCSLRKPDRAVFTCVHMCPQVAVRKGFRAFWAFHRFTQIYAKKTRRWQQESLLGVCSAWRFFRGMSK